MQRKVAQNLAAAKWIVGVDEAGRGPVVGPMVYAAAYCPADFEPRLKEMGVADSKVLTAEMRKAHFASIAAIEELGYVADCTPATVISHKMLEKRPVSLNLIALESTIRILTAVQSLDIEIEHVFGSASTHEKRLKQLFPNLQFTVRPKADALFPIVGLASIVAKVIRDDAIKEIQSRNQLNIGSGYPSDPDTRSWLLQTVDPVFGFGPDVRFSWSTCSSLLTEKATQIKWHEGDKKQTELMRFLQPTDSVTQTSKSSFPRRRKIEKLDKDPFITSKKG